MPLTDLQREILGVLAETRTDERYLAGGAALHFAPDSIRYSHDLDFFHDATGRVASTFNADRDTLSRSGFDFELVFSQPGFIRALVGRGTSSTQIDWAHDSAWRFMPLVRDDLGGLLLHEVDLAVNKALALAGRNEARDLVDILWIDDRILPVGALVWAAVAKDPGFTPRSLLAQLRRAGRFRPEEIARLDLSRPFDLVDAKSRWLSTLDAAETFIESRPDDEVGCLYYAAARERFEAPTPDGDLRTQGLALHYGRPGGVLPRPADQRFEAP